MNTKFRIESVIEIVENSKAFLFDFDGTLVNLDKLNVDSFAYVFKEMFNLDFTKEDFMKYLSGKGAHNGLREYLELNGVTDFSSKEILTRFSEQKNQLIEKRLENEIYLMPGVKEFLERFKDYKRYIVITSSRKKYVEKMLTYYDVYKYFEEVFDRYAVIRGKPSPEPFLKGLDYLDMDAGDCIAFEDSFYGLQSAKGAGLFTVGILNKGWNDDFVYQLGDYIISDYKELLFT
jgi:beta-phosphoglucomutase